MADAQSTLDVIRRNRSDWSLRRQLAQATQQVKVTIPTVVTSGTDPALAPLGSELANYSDEFDTAQLNGAWGWNNQGTSTATLRTGRVLIAAQVAGAGVNSVRILARPVVPGIWTIRTRMTHNSTVLYGGGGLVAYRAATGKFVLQSALCRAAGTPTSCRLLTGYWTNTTTFGTVVRDDNPPLVETRQWTMQMRYDGTFLFFDYSWDNVVFFNIASVSAATALGGAPDTFGIASNIPGGSSPGAATAFEWFRCYGNANVNQG